MADTSNLTQFLTDVADAIKEKTGKTDKIPAANFDTEIKAIKTGGVKLFESVDKMNADVTAKDGDLAVVYRNDTENWDGSTEITELLFPKRVILTESSTGSCSLRNGFINRILGSVSETKASFNISTRLTSKSITYTSEDGLVYDRDGDTEAVTVSDTALKFTGSLSDVCANFMKIGGYVFEGLFCYASNKYDYASTQLTLSGANELLPNSIAYGKTGVITGDSTVYDNLNWSEIPTTAIDTDYLLTTIDSVCIAPSTKIEDTSAVKNQMLAVTSGNKQLNFRCDFNLTKIKQYLESLGLQLNSNYGHFTYDYYTGNLYYTIQKEKGVIIVIIYNIFTKQLSSIDIPIETNDSTIWGEVTIDIVTRDIYFVYPTGVNKGSFSMNAEDKIQCFKLDVDGLTYERIFTYVPTENDSNMTFYETIVMNGKIYLSWYSTNTQTAYIYVYKNSEMIQLLALEKPSGLGSGYFGAYLSDKNSIQIDGIRYFMTYNNYASSTLYKLDMNTDTVTKLLDFNNYGIPAPSKNGSIAWNSTSFVAKDNKLYGCNYISDGTYWGDGEYYVNTFVYDISTNTINVLNFAENTGIQNSQATAGLLTIYIDADIVNNTIVFRLNTKRYILDLDTLTVTTETDANITYPRAIANTKIKLNNRSYVISGSGDGLYSVLHLWNSDLSDILSSDVRLIATDANNFSVITIDKYVYNDTITPNEYDEALATTLKIKPDINSSRDTEMADDM